MLPDVIKNDVEVDNQIKVSNLLEPELSELVRLFYWINVCRRIIDKESFELKFNEFRGAVQFENESKFRKRLNNKFITFGRIMKDGVISYDNIKGICNSASYRISILELKSLVSCQNLC